MNCIHIEGDIMQKMKEILDIPSYYNDLLKEISSENLHPLLNSNPLEYMRNLFTIDNKKFYNLRDELILRGIGFHKKYQNNYLLGRNYEIQNVLIKTENTDSFKKINFSVIGASNFIERFQITSDLFFHNVPWEGLLSLFPNTAESFLRRAFEKEGFSFAPIEGYQAIPLMEAQSDDNNLVKEPMYIENDYLYDYSQLELPIEHYFQGNIFQHFLKYCQANNIQIFSDLSLDKINDYAKQKFTRQKTIQLITKIYHDINKKYNPLPYDFEDALNLYQNNRFKKLCEMVDVYYLEYIEKFYESDNPYENIYRQEDIEQFISYVNSNIESIVKEKQNKEKQAKFKEVVQKINEHANFKYILSMPLHELIEVFSIQESIPNEELYVYDILDNIHYLSLLEKLLIGMDSMVELSEMLTSITELLKEREKEIILLRDTLTLQEVGDKIGVTRERVRQVEAALIIL